MADAEDGVKQLPQEIIRRKRDGEVLDEIEIAAIVQGIANGTLADAQVGAFAMAAYLNGMTADETVALTRAMTASGRTIDWSGTGLPGPVVDKHSTGGVGDKVSLILAPLVAACGGYVPMISGRGLGHTGGTLDKLDSIPGYDTAPDLATFQRVVSEVGCAIIGQTDDLAPADRRLYAARDVTATVESVPLITASILSKKLAAGLDALVMDVKTGSGAFADDMEMAQALAASIIDVADGAGLPCTALITDMNQVLGSSAGNALEVGETAAYLTDETRDPRLHDVVVALASSMLTLGSLATDAGDARQQIDTALDSGAAADRFARMVHALGGPKDLLERPDAYLPQAPVQMDVVADRTGMVSEMNVMALGFAVVVLGGGRRRPTDAIDHAVGLSDVVPLGAGVTAGESLMTVHAADEASAEAAAGQVRSAIRISDTAPASVPVILDRLGEA